MSYTVTIEGFEIICNTPEDAIELIQAFKRQQQQKPLLKKTEKEMFHEGWERIFGER